MTNQPAAEASRKQLSKKGQVVSSHAWLRNVGGHDDECWVPCAKGDPGAVLFVPAVTYFPDQTGDDQ